MDNSLEWLGKEIERLNAEIERLNIEIDNRDNVIYELEVEIIELSEFYYSRIEQHYD